ncbi:hypothetical protein [Massilia sp. TWR1-2-2]|uniref:hypothetical protein n=1 Tax=Massilia sp. TWR1-2-2 TaxID=2804584 RepID=UPI003CF1A0A6
MDAACLLPVTPDTLVALRDYLRDSGSALSVSAAATMAIGAWLRAANDRDLMAAGASPQPQSTARVRATHLEAVNVDAQSDAADAHPEDDTIARTSADADADADADAKTNAKSMAKIRAKTTASANANSSLDGYQWKELFLPDGTELRMCSNNAVHRARVTGAAIFYQGRQVSPRQFTLAVAGDGRNAWRDLSLRLPGENQFLPAGLLRRRAQADIRMRAEAQLGERGMRGAEASRRGSPADTIAAAADAMGDALRTALALVEHSNTQSLPKYERRVDPHRRTTDVLVNHIKFD